VIFSLVSEAGIGPAFLSYLNQAQGKLEVKEALVPSESTNWMIGPRQNLNVKVWQLIARKILSRDLERSALKGPGKKKRDEFRQT
jgi:hypothetical protein